MDEGDTRTAVGRGRSREVPRPTSGAPVHDLQAHSQPLYDWQRGV